MSLARITFDSQVVEKSSAVEQSFWIVMFSLLTAVGSQIQLPHQPVPYTMQTFFVLLSGALLGRRNGAMSQLLYLLAGTCGAPVFSGWGYGIARLIGPTGGYLLSFPIAAFVVGDLVHREHRLLLLLISMTVGLLIVFSLGTLQLNVLYLHNWSQSISDGFLIFSFWDLAKIVAATLVVRQLMVHPEKS